MHQTTNLVAKLLTLQSSLDTLNFFFSILPRCTLSTALSVSQEENTNYLKVHSSGRSVYYLNGANP